MFLRLRDNSNNFVSEGLIKMMKQQRNHSLQCESRNCEHFDGGASDIDFHSCSLRAETRRMLTNVQ